MTALHGVYIAILFPVLSGLYANGDVATKAAVVVAANIPSPLDPYGFQVVWDNFSEPMSEITKNPPLACYYLAAIGSIAGWSERALHLGFLLPAIALVLGIYRLSMRFTRLPLIATLAALLTPGVLVSASSVMCDVMMLAFWIWAAVLWLEGFDQGKRSYLIASSLLLTSAALTKYFGICLLPLLLTYSIARKRRLGWWALYFLIPIVLLGAYQLWTTILYGHAMFSDALNWAQAQRVINGKASLSAEMALRLEKALGVDMELLLRMQALHDASTMRRREGEIDVKPNRPSATEPR